MYDVGNIISTDGGASTFTYLQSCEAGTAGAEQYTMHTGENFQVPLICT